MSNQQFAALVAKMVKSKLDRAINLVHRAHLICMFISIVSGSRFIASSYRFGSRNFAFVDTIKHQSKSHRIFTATSSQHLLPLHKNKRMPPQPNNSVNTISSVSMSAIEETKPISSKIPPQTTKAKLLSAKPSSLQQCGERIRSGNLVSFPTETVYGLGCHALDPIAVQKVFDAKERPLSDPLIVHVTKSTDALELWEASSSLSDNTGGDSSSADNQQQQIEKQALTTLTTSFFPGPLTIVAKAHPTIPQILMANTGYVACRSPSHPIARELINAAKVPIAAPSANKFGHVSPTLAQHVYDDLKYEDVWIVDPTLGIVGNDDNVSPPPQDKDNASETAVCQVGVESTVAKIEMNHGNNNDDGSSSQILGSITVLRHGAISSQAIRDALQKDDLLQYFDVSDSVKFTSEKTYNVAPGQTVKHYSPNVPCFMLGVSRQAGSDFTINDEELPILSQSVIIDYGKRLEQYKKHALAYRDLSSNGNPTIAASNIFETLRWSETIDGAKRVYVPEIVLEVDSTTEDGRALVLAVKDKLTRAASAVVVDVFK